MRANAGIEVSGDRVEIEHTEGRKECLLVRAGPPRLVVLGGSEPHFGQGDGGNREVRRADRAGAGGERGGAPLARPQ